jgi:hypothetical protein
LNKATKIHKSLERKNPQKRPICRPRKSSILLQPQQIKKEKEGDEEHKGAINTKGKDNHTINGSQKSYFLLLKGLSKGMGETLML